MNTGYNSRDPSWDSARTWQPTPRATTTIKSDVISTTVTTEAQGGGAEYFYSDWPWWWWIAVASGGTVLLITLLCCIGCCCCRRRRRNAARSAAEDGGVEIHVHPPTGLRRMNSSAAKRYLHNVVSIFSWGSDFEIDKDPSNGRNEYANPQAIGLTQDDLAESSLTPPPRPPRKRKSDNIYLNVNPTRPPR